jgi:uncharacterized protein YecE (DUF72 family)
LKRPDVRRLAEAGLLGGVLFQLSPYFENEGSALDDLEGVLDAVSHPEFDYALSSGTIVGWTGAGRR